MASWWKTQHCAISYPPFNLNFKGTCFKQRLQQELFHFFNVFVCPRRDSRYEGHLQIFLLSRTTCNTSRIPDSGSYSYFLKAFCNSVMCRRFYTPLVFCRKSKQGRPSRISKRCWNTKHFCKFSRTCEWQTSRGGCRCQPCSGSLFNQIARFVNAYLGR